MARYIAKRLVTSIALLFLSTIVIFLLMRVIPGDPTITKLGGSIKEVDQSTLDQIRHELGLDQSLPQQYLTWITGIAHGDFGSSYFSQFSVTTLIGQRIGATLLLALMAMVIGLAIAVPACVAGAIWPNRYPQRRPLRVRRDRDRDPDLRDRDRADHRVRRRARPPPHAGLRVVSARPRGAACSSTLLPAITLGIGVAALTMRILRASLVEVGSASFVRTARGKGLLRRQVVTRHELPNASIPGDHPGRASSSRISSAAR